MVHLARFWSGKLRQPLGLFFMLWLQQGDSRKKKKAEEGLPVLGDWPTWRPSCRKDFMPRGSGVLDTAGEGMQLGEATSWCAWDPGDIWGVLTFSFKLSKSWANCVRRPLWQGEGRTSLQGAS